MKRLLLLTTLLLCLATAGAESFTVDGIKYGVTSTENLTVEVLNPNNGLIGDGYSGEVVIPNTVEYNNKNYSVTSIGYGAFYECSGLTSVTIPNSVIAIKNLAFYGCSSLTSITIPNSVTTIEDWTFMNCSSLISITIPNSVTSIGEEAFDGCSSLTSITIPNSVTSIGSSAFAGTAWYNNQPDGLVYAGKVAYRYKGDMPTNTTIIFEDGTLGIAGDAFFDCKGLTSLTIPSSVTSIGGGAFAGCI